MRTIASVDAARDWRKLANEVAREPVRVTGAGEAAIVVMSEAEFDRLKGQAWTRLFSAMDRLSAEAKASGLTEDKLDELLADES